MNDAYFAKNTKKPVISTEITGFFYSIKAKS